MMQWWLGAQDTEGKRGQRGVGRRRWNPSWLRREVDDGAADRWGSAVSGRKERRDTWRGLLGYEARPVALLGRCSMASRVEAGAGHIQEVGRRLRWRVGPSSEKREEQWAGLGCQREREGTSKIPFLLFQNLLQI